jgi:hypothetical protein
MNKFQNNHPETKTPSNNQGLVCIIKCGLPPVVNDWQVLLQGVDFNW